MPTPHSLTNVISSLKLSHHFGFGLRMIILKTTAVIGQKAYTYCLLLSPAVERCTYDSRLLCFLQSWLIAVQLISVMNNKEEKPFSLQHVHALIISLGGALTDNPVMQIDAFLPSPLAVLQ